MRLKKIEVNFRTTGKYITLNKVCVFFFSKDLSLELNLKQGDKISFFQDEEKLSDWYFTISNDADLNLRVVQKKSGTHYLVNCGAAAKQIKKSIGIYNDKTIKIMVGLPTIDKDIMYYPLITAPLITNK